MTGTFLNVVASAIAVTAVILRGAMNDRETSEEVLLTSGGHMLFGGMYHVYKRRTEISVKLMHAEVVKTIYGTMLLFLSPFDRIDVSVRGCGSSRPDEQLMRE